MGIKTLENCLNRRHFVGERKRLGKRVVNEKRA